VSSRAITERVGPLSYLSTAFSIYLLLLLLSGAAALWVPQFTAPANLANVVNQSAALAVLAIGQTFVIACGMIDLSVGQLLGLVAVLACDLMAGRSAWVAPAVMVALAVGLCVGLLNGVLNNRLRIHPLILTFGMLSVLQGTIFLYTDRSTGLAAPQILWLAGGTVGGVPVSILVIAATGFAAHWLLQRTRFGIHLRAVGSSEDAARRAGIDVSRIKLLVFLLSGASAALAGLIVAGRLGTGYPNAGTGFELDAIVAVVLGGTSLAGGRGTIPGTLAAVLVLGISSNVLNLMEVSAFVQMVVKGLIVVAAVLVNQPRERALA
jgi:ribose/xylose/arabinose/galactoside ABC-type transport system permease subunit